jgi:hypothetical protein
MIKTMSLGLVAAVAMMLTSGAFAEEKAGGKGCCAKNASHSEKVASLDYATLNLTTDQKSKIETWQGDCVKAGCTKESRRTFLKQAKGILSPEQFANLKEQCKGHKKDGKTQA